MDYNFVRKFGNHGYKNKTSLSTSANFEVRSLITSPHTQHTVSVTFITISSSIKINLIQTTHNILKLK